VWRIGRLKRLPQSTRKRLSKPDDVPSTSQNLSSTPTSSSSPWYLLTLSSIISLALHKLFHVTMTTLPTMAYCIFLNMHKFILLLCGVVQKFLCSCNYDIDILHCTAGVCMCLSAYVEAVCEACAAASLHWEADWQCLLLSNVTGVQWQQSFSHSENCWWTRKTNKTQRLNQLLFTAILSSGSNEIYYINLLNSCDRNLSSPL